MKDLIFIDANVFVLFFAGNGKEYTALFDVLIKNKDSIITTRQVYSEIKRNKLNTICRFISSLPDTRFSANVPSHFIADDSTLSELNNTAKTLSQNAEDFSRKTSSIFEKLVSDVSESKDDISKKIEVLFENAKETTTTVLAKANKRKQLGNPPGKKGGPLGDEINWEIVLESIKDADSLTIISQDTDFYSKFHKNEYLNPYLLSELKEINPNIKVNFSTKLTHSINTPAFSKRKTGKPIEEEIKAFKEVETLFESRATPLATDLRSHSPNYDLPPSICWKCQSQNSFTSGSYLRSQYGGLTWQYICNKCGSRYDTGDYFD